MDMFVILLKLIRSFCVNKFVPVCHKSKAQR